jgi:hypothetical protein
VASGNLRTIFPYFSQFWPHLFPNLNVSLLDNRHKVIYNVGQSGELWGTVPHPPMNRGGWWGKDELSIQPLADQGDTNHASHLLYGVFQISNERGA